MKLLVTIPLLIFISLSISVRAQSTIIFNINLKPQLEDSTFIPGRDTAELSGNLYPFQKNRNMVLKDLAPIDSIFSVEVAFPRREMGKSLQYYFILKTENGVMRENIPRVLDLRNGEHSLDALYFNSYAF